jgi:hypothetical protein
MSFSGLEARTFRYLGSGGPNGLIPTFPPVVFERCRGGLRLTAYPIGVERGYVTRAGARAVDAALLAGPAGPGARGWRATRDFHHFLSAGRHPLRAGELSSLDTALLIAGVLFCQSY